MSTPCRDQADRDVIDDVGLVDTDDRAGSGDYAQNIIEGVAS